MPIAAIHKHCDLGTRQPSTARSTTIKPKMGWGEIAASMAPTAGRPADRKSAVS